MILAGESPPDGSLGATSDPSSEDFQIVAECEGRFPFRNTYSTRAQKSMTRFTVIVLGPPLRREKGAGRHIECLLILRGPSPSQTHPSAHDDPAR